MTVSKTMRTDGPLTVKQLEILAAMADGYSYTEIGQRTFIPYDTVRTNATAILAKLRARNKAHAVAIAFRSHIFETRAIEEEAL
jgi:DNA-binding CsgD family transcriptional regulator